MFKAELEVPRLILCRRLKTLGYPQEGDGWYWVEILEYGKISNWHLIFPSEKPEEYAYVIGDKINNVIKAPTIGELGAWLPKKAIKEDIVYFLRMEKESIYYETLCLLLDPYLIRFVNDTEANLRATMLIWLIENKYFKFK